MKKITTTFLAASLLMMYSCNDGEKSTSNETTTTNMSTDSGKGMMDDQSTTTDANNAGNAAGTDNNMTMTFANEAASGGMMEVELAKLARQNGASADVKAFAKMIEEDHTKANSELKSIAASKNMTLPSELMSNHQKHIDDMMKMKGMDFDHHYIDMMVEDHNADIASFKNASANLTDEQLKAFATKTLPVLQKHLDKAKSLKEKMDKM